MELNRREGTKNIICQLLAPSQIISLSKVEETRSYVVAIDGGERTNLSEMNLEDTILAYFMDKKGYEEGTTFSHAGDRQRQSGWTPFRPSSGR